MGQGDLVMENNAESSPSIPANRFPPRLASLKFTAGKSSDSHEYITPPLITIPTGAFLMGTEKPKDDTYVDAREMPQHCVEVAAFQLAKYPVTVAEYALAVRDGAVREPPILNGSIVWSEQLYRLDHPVVHVTWDEANAYIIWLRRVTGQDDWRLPTEAEWEKAARWDSQRSVSRIYPWGDAFDKNRCDAHEDGFSGRNSFRSSTTPIGSYPAEDPARSGASPFGVEEMAGSVREWTSSLFRPYPYVQGDGREDQTVRNVGFRGEHPSDSRVVRGGSWTSGAHFSRAAWRMFDARELHYDSVGFRLALSLVSGAGPT
jgi:formylglycine-generating enzyme required for sulfatase activity